MFSCKDVSTLTSEQFDRKLTFYERIAMAIHRFICPPCRAYKKQMNLLRNRMTSLHTESGETLEGDARERIRARLRQKQQDQ